MSDDEEGGKVGEKDIKIWQKRNKSWKKTLKTFNLVLFYSNNLKLA